MIYGSLPGFQGSNNLYKLSEWCIKSLGKKTKSFLYDALSDKSFL
jgi:hypothetical protein